MEMNPYAYAYAYALDIVTDFIITARSIQGRLVYSAAR